MGVAGCNVRWDDSYKAGLPMRSVPRLPPEFPRPENTIARRKHNRIAIVAARWGSALKPHEADQQIPNALFKLKMKSLWAPSLSF